MVSGKKTVISLCFSWCFQDLRDGFWQKNGDFLVFFHGVFRTLEMVSGKKTVIS